jgi:hypothetical protein
MTGSCPCGQVTFKLLKPPLFVYACHCPVCQKASGTAFAIHANIERTAVAVTSTTQPVALAAPYRRCTACPTCAAILWGNEVFGAPICDVRVGTLDTPNLLEPDWHAFITSKLNWVTLPPDARTSTGHYDMKTAWPKDSLRRFMACLEEWNEKGLDAEKDVEKKEAYDGSEGEGEGEGEGEKTPTGDEGVSEDEESDEAFEERFRETERKLTERLEMLSLKLNENAHGKVEGAKTGDQATKDDEATKDDKVTENVKAA